MREHPPKVKDRSCGKILDSEEHLDAVVDQATTAIQLDLLELCTPADGAPTPATSVNTVTIASEKTTALRRGLLACPPAGQNPARVPHSKTPPSHAPTPNGRGREARPTNEPLYLGVENVARRYDVSVASIWRWVSAGRFPRPRKLAGGTTRWSIADLEAHERTLG